MDRDIAAYYISGKEIVKHVRESLDFSQDIFVLVERFNNQREQVAIASKAGETAGRRYSANVETFMIGKLSVLDLNDSHIRNDESRCDYINQLFQYWYYYYQLRSLTLTDPCTGRPVTSEIYRLVR